MTAPVKACPLRQLLASRHLDSRFDWPADNCPDCGKRLPNSCTCGK